jgi:hypothetical protein
MLLSNSKRSPHIGSKYCKAKALKHSCSRSRGNRMAERFRVVVAAEAVGVAATVSAREKKAAEKRSSKIALPR